MESREIDALLTKLEEEAAVLASSARGASDISAWLLRHQALLLRLRTATGPLSSKLSTDEPPGSRVVGHSPALASVLAVVARVASTDAAVLIGGETGTGKELVARRLHFQSRRVDGPFIALNCGALAAELVESELFGHERGAFTGAMNARVGRFEAAAGGTIFLDEVGELSASAQAKLLRILAEGAYERVGSSETRRTDVRVIAATHRNLGEDVASGRFRQDLYYRLNVIRIHVPPLRERKSDISLLSDHFVRLFAREHGRPVTHIHAAAMVALEDYSWPGNIRELANAVERAVILAPGAELTTDLFSLGPESEPPPSLPDEGARDMKSALRGFKRRLVQSALVAARGNSAEAAKALGVHPKYLYELVRELDLPPASGGNGRRSTY